MARNQQRRRNTPDKPYPEMLAGLMAVIRNQIWARGENRKLLRSFKGIAAKAGVSPLTVSKLAHSEYRRGPSAASLMAVAEALGIKLAYTVDGLPLHQSLKGVEDKAEISLRRK